MSHFINIEDYDASMHREVLCSITRDDQAIIEACEERALAQMRGYLCTRYDCDHIFAQQGAARHPLILMYALDITIYHLLSIHNPQKMSELRKARYEEAIEYLNGVSRGRISFENVPLAQEDIAKRNTPMQALSNPKRTNRL